MLLLQFRWEQLCTNQEEHSLLQSFLGKLVQTSLSYEFLQTQFICYILFMHEHASIHTLTFKLSVMVMEKPVSSSWTWKNVTNFSLPLFYTALYVFRRLSKCWLKTKNELTLPGAVKFSIPIRSLCSSVNFWKFSSRMRLLWSWVAMSATSFRASMSKQKYMSIQNSSEINLRKHLPPLL